MTREEFLNKWRLPPGAADSMSEMDSDLGVLLRKYAVRTLIDQAGPIAAMIADEIREQAALIGEVK